MYKLILFDLDDTLTDFTKVEKASLKVVCEHFNIDFNDFYQIYKPINSECYQMEEQGLIALGKARYLRFERCLKKLNLVGNPVLFNDVFYKAMVKTYYPREGLYETLDYLSKKYELGIASNGPHNTQIGKLKTLSVLSYFQYFFLSEDIGYNKPHQQFFDYILDKVKLDKTQIIIVGDNPRTEILGALRANIDTIWLNNGNREYTLKKWPKWEINKLSSLKELL